MRDLMRIAFLNVLRNRRRTILTLSSIVVGYMALACFGGFIEFSFVGLRETMIRTQLGHVQIHRAGYNQGHIAEPTKYMIENPDRLEKMLSKIDGVEVVTQRLSFSGLATVGNNSVNVEVMGIDPRKNESFADFETLINGRQIRRTESDTGVAGAELLKGMGAEIGDWVTLVVSSVDGLINAVDFRIVGSVQTGSQDFDEVFVKIPLKLAQRARDTQSVEEIVVLLEKTENLSQVFSLIEERLAEEDEGHEMSIWSDIAPYYHRVVALYSGLFDVFTVIVGVVVMFSVANTVMMSVFERTPEIGALRAIGASRNRILAMFLLEGFVLGAIGALLGAIGAWLATGFVDAFGGISVPPPPGMSRGYQARFLLGPEVMGLATGVTMLAAVVSSIYPAVAAARLNIVAALDHA